MVKLSTGAQELIDKVRRHYAPTKAFKIIDWKVLEYLVKHPGQYGAIHLRRALGTSESWMYMGLKRLCDEGLVKLSEGKSERRYSRTVQHYSTDLDALARVAEAVDVGDCFKFIFGGK